MAVSSKMLNSNVRLPSLTIHPAFVDQEENNFEKIVT